MNVNICSKTITIKDLTIDTQLKTDTKPIKQTGTHPLPKQRSTWIRKIDWKRAFRKCRSADRNFFRLTSCHNHKKDKSVKIALDSRKLNKSCVKRKATLPNTEEFIQERRRKMDVKNWPGLSLRTSQYIQGSVEALQLLHNWRWLHRTLPFEKGFTDFWRSLRSSRNTSIKSWNLKPQYG